MYYILGILAGIVTVFLWEMLSKHRAVEHGGYYFEGDKYDERQILARGYAYKWGYLTIMIMLMVNCCIIDIAGWWCTIDVVCFGSIFIGGMVFATISIFKDAFFTTYEKSIYKICLFLLGGLLNVAGAVRTYMNNKSMFDSNGKFDNLNLICAIFLLYVALILLIKRSISKEDGDEYEES